jgi:hypothetical protein
MTTNPSTHDLLPLPLPNVETALPTDRAALEKSVIDGYESGTLSLFEVQQKLGFDNRWVTENWLGDHGVCRNYSMEDLEEDRRTLARLFPE